MSGDVRKLPKWAQQRIELLEMRLREANARLDGVLGVVERPPGTRCMPRGAYAYMVGDLDTAGRGSCRRSRRS